MPRARVPRLSWVRFFPEDFLGGTQQMDCRQVGQYILALCAQWGAERGAERTGLRTADGALRATLRGEELDAIVRAKFDSVTLPQGVFLRNKRMSLEISDSVAEWEAKVKGGLRTAEQDGVRGAERTANRTATTITTTSTSVQPEAQPKPKRIRPQPSASDPWNREFVDDFRAQYGGDPGKPLFKHVGAVVEKLGWPATRPVLKALMAETALEYLNLPKVLAVRVQAAANGHQQKPPDQIKREAAQAAELAQREAELGAQAERDARRGM